MLRQRFHRDTDLFGQIFFDHAQETIDVGKTGWDVKRPVIAGACDSGCPWGELGDFVQESMKPYGYSVIICRNCNRSYGPRLVSKHDYPPPLDEANLEDGVNVRLNARVDFGLTSSAMVFGNVLRNGTYPISVSSERIFQAIAIIEYAKKIGAKYVAHVHFRMVGRNSVGNIF